MRVRERLPTSFCRFSTVEGGNPDPQNVERSVQVAVNTLSARRESESLAVVRVVRRPAVRGHADICWAGFALARNARLSRAHLAFSLAGDGAMLNAFVFAYVAGTPHTIFPPLPEVGDARSLAAPYSPDSRRRRRDGSARAASGNTGRCMPLPITPGEPAQGLVSGSSCCLRQTGAIVLVRRRRLPVHAGSRHASPT